LTPLAKLSTADGNTVDRRLRPRYRLSNPISIRRSGGGVVPGMTLEISESGMSVSTGEALNGGERVEIELVVELKLPAVVRRMQGRVYGLEFLNLSEAQIECIKKICECLPRFRAGSLQI
jgi:hypothetical protein